MKLLSFSTLAASLIFLMSVNGVAVDKNAKPQVPHFSFENSYGACSSDDIAGHGKYLLLQFWDASDASSRVNNRKFATLAEKVGNDSLEYVGVYTGSDKTLFKSAMAADGCEISKQYFLADKEDAANIYADFSLSSGNHTFLIAPDGRIAAINPTEEQIKTIENNGTSL